MGGTGHTRNEAAVGRQNGDDTGNSGTSRYNRSDAVSGYKKLAVVLLAFAVIVTFRTFILDRVVVSGNSMNPAFADGDVLWARKFNVEELARYQVVTAKVDGKSVIKRVVGLPGEALQIIDGFVYINGEKLVEDRGYQTAVYGIAEEVLVLGENEYFLMGDNRNHSLDSRTWGAVDIEDIKGVVTVRFFPFWKIGLVE